jgi:chromosome segregation ATPase
MWQRMKAKHTKMAPAPMQQPQSIPMAVTMEEDDSNDETLNISAWAMMEVDQTSPMALLMQDPSLLGTSFLSTSTATDESFVPPVASTPAQYLRKWKPPITLETPASPLRQDETLSSRKVRHLDDGLDDVVTDTKKRLVSFSGPSAMLERNQTLVKEVKFAEQTCVELSQRNLGLEKDVDRLEQDNDDLRNNAVKMQAELVMCHRANATLEAQKVAAEQQWAVERQSSKQLVETLEQKNKSLELELAELKSQKSSKSPPTPEKMDHRSSTGSPTSRVLAGALESELIREHAGTDRVVEMERDALRAQVTILQSNQGLDPQSKNRIATLEEENKNLEWSVASYSRKVAGMKEELTEVRQQCQVYDQEARSARAEVKQAKQRLQEEFYEMTAAALHQMERHTQRIQEAVNNKISDYNDRFVEMSDVVDFLKESLDFQSEIGSIEVDTTSYSAEVDEGPGSDGDAVLDATFSKPSVSNREFDDERLLVQMEEARLSLRDPGDAIWCEDSTFDEGISVPKDDRDFSGDTLSIQALRMLAGEFDDGEISGTYPNNAEEFEGIHDKQDAHVEVLGEKVRDLTFRAEQAAKENQSLHFALDKANGDVQRVKEEMGRMRESKSTVEEKNHNLAMLQNENAAVLEEKKNMSQALLEKEEELNAARQRNVTLRNEIQLANKSLAEKVDLLREIDMETAIVAEKRAGLSASLSYLLDQAKSEINRLEIKLREANRVNDELSSRNEHLILQLNEEVAARKRDSQRLEDRLRKDDLMISNQELLERRVGELHDALLHSENELNRLKFLYVSCNDKLAAATDLASEHKRLAENYKGQYETALKSSTEGHMQAASLQSAVDVLQRTNEELRAAIASLKDQQAQEAHGETGAIIADLEAEGSQLRDDCRQLQVALAENKHDLDSLRLSHDSSNDNLAAATKLASEKQAMTVEFKEKYETALEALNESKGEASSLKKVADALKRTNEELLSSIASLKSELQQKREAHGEMQTVIGALEEERDQLGGQCRQLQLTLSKETNKCVELTAEVQMLNSKVAEFQSALPATKYDAQLQISTRDRTINELKNVVSDYASTNEEHLSKNSDLRRQIASQNTEIERLIVSYVTCNDKLAAMSEENDEHLAQIDQLNEVTKFAEGRVLEYSDELSRTRQKLEIVQMDRTDLDNRLALTKNELKFKTDRLLEYQDTMNRLTSSSATAVLTLEEGMTSSPLSNEAIVSDITESLYRLMNDLGAANVDVYKSLRQAGIVTVRRPPQPVDGNSSHLKRTLDEASEELIILKGLVATSCETFVSQTYKIEELESAVKTMEKDRDRLQDSRDQMEFDLLRERARVSELNDQVKEAGVELVRAVNESADISKALHEARGDKGEEMQEIIGSLMRERDVALERELEGSSAVTFLTGKLEESARVL